MFLITSKYSLYVEKNEALEELNAFVKNKKIKVFFFEKFLIY